jgi:hypothetical protein
MVSSGKALEWERVRGACAFIPTCTSGEELGDGRAGRIYTRALHTSCRCTTNPTAGQKMATAQTASASHTSPGILDYSKGGDDQKCMSITNSESFKDVSGQRF